ncbi:MAG TPA: amidohydrolase [Micromonosporaceae bacterium]|jgi:hypothetical protein
MTVRYARATRVWVADGWVPDALIAFGDGQVRLATQAEAATAEPVGVLVASVLPPVTDSHVHLDLSDCTERGFGVLARVLDLGWEPRSLPSSARHGARPPQILTAGAFLTAPGGYPSTRPWAARGSVNQVTDEAAAVSTVNALVAGGAAIVKVSLNANAGPVFSDAVLRAIVDHAHSVGLRVVAHVEGDGQEKRALLAHVDWFAHTPWTQRLSDDELAPMLASVGWISTLDMHGRGSYGEEFATAIDNFTRFAAMGGRVAYGTDLGNDLTRTDLNPREIAALRAAGLDAHRIIGAVTGSALLPSFSGGPESPTTLTLLPADVVDEQDVLDALTSSIPVHATDLEDHLS